MMTCSNFSQNMVLRYGANTDYLLEQLVFQTDYRRNCLWINSAKEKRNWTVYWTFQIVMLLAKFFFKNQSIVFGERIFWTTLLGFVLPSVENVELFCSRQERSFSIYFCILSQKSILRETYCINLFLLTSVEIILREETFFLCVALNRR